MSFYTSLLAMSLIVIVCNAANVPVEVSSKDFFEELTKEQHECLISVYHVSSCDVMDAVDACGQSDGGKLTLG
jgi:hypothetical protein